MFKSSLLAFSLFAAPVVHATEVPPAMSQYIYDDLMRWINHAQIVSAVAAHNSQTNGLSQDEINRRDAAWRAEIGNPDSVLISNVLNAPLSDFLRQHLDAAEGRITEVFVMDGRGLNVAASTVVSGYWQGDEARFRETYPKGSGSVFIDEIRHDATTQTYKGQVSFALTDPASGEVIGAVTVGLNAASFF